MKSKIVLKWTKRFYRVLMVLVLVVFSTGYMFIDEYRKDICLRDVIMDTIDALELRAQGEMWASFDILEISLFASVYILLLILMILSFVKPKKFKFFKFTFVIDIILLVASIAPYIVSLFYDDMSASREWMLIVICTTLMFVLAIIGMICEKRVIKKTEEEPIIEEAGNKKGLSIVLCSVYGIISVAIVIVYIIFSLDKGWKLDDDTMYVYRTIRTSENYFDDFGDYEYGQTVWGDIEFEELEFEKGIEKIYYMGLEANEDLEKVKLPKGLEVIGECAFKNCEMLEEIDIPDSVEIIENNAFWYCENLKNVDIPEGLEEIGDYAFYTYEGGIEEIYIPKSVKHIGQEAFPEGTIIYGEYGSYAERFVEKYEDKYGSSMGYTFVGR